jgi:hypothetical protein
LNSPPKVQKLDVGDASKDVLRSLELNCEDCEDCEDCETLPEKSSPTSGHSLGAPRSPAFDPKPGAVKFGCKVEL